MRKVLVSVAFLGVIALLAPAHAGPNPESPPQQCAEQNGCGVCTDEYGGQSPCQQPPPPPPPPQCDPLGRGCTDPVGYVLYVTYKLPHCTLVDWHGGKPRIQTDPVLGLIEVDPDGCVRGLLPGSVHP